MKKHKKDKKQNPPGHGVSRRTLIRNAAGAGATLASGIAAPAVLAQVNKPIRLGNISSYTGGLAYSGQANWNAVQLYFDSINWTVAGRKIEIIKEDDQFSPQVGLQKAKKLLESDRVDLVFGIQASNVALAVLNYMKQQKAFYVVTGAGTDAITWNPYPYVFRTSISTYQLSTPMAEYVFDNLGKTVVTVSSDYAGGRDVVAAFKRPYLAKGGKILKEIWPPLGTTDFSAYLTDVKSIDPPVTYDFMPGADAVRYVQQYSEFGLKAKMPLTGFTMIDAQSTGALGKAAVGVISALTFVDTLDNPQAKAFTAAYQSRFKARPDLFADYGYVGARVIGEALRMVDGDAANKDKLAEAMAKVQFDAPRGPFRFDPMTHNPIQDVYIAQVVETDGRITTKTLATARQVRDPGHKV